MEIYIYWDRRSDVHVRVNSGNVACFLFTQFVSILMNYYLSNLGSWFSIFPFLCLKVDDCSLRPVV